MSTHTEIERKFLVTQLPDHLAELPHVEITQGYLAFDERGLEVRLRKVGKPDISRTKFTGVTRALSER